MTTIVATALLALLIPVSGVASALEGKAIICLEEVDLSRKLVPEAHPTERIYRGFKFVEGDKVEGYILRHTDNISRVERFDDGTRGRRFEFAESVEFWNDWTLDRKTLVLSVKLYGGNKGEYSCEVFSNFDDYEKAFEEYRKQEQKAIDRIMEGNRI